MAQGITYFDTAPHYGHGLSEHRVGRVLRGLPRDAFVLSTKVGRLLAPDRQAPSVQHGYVDTLPFVQRYDYSGRACAARSTTACSASGLRASTSCMRTTSTRPRTAPRMRRACATCSDTGLPALAELEAEGRIDGYGLGVNEVEICLQVLAHADPDVLLLAGRYTLADQTALARLLPACERRGVAVVLGGPFNSGILASGARPIDGSTPYFNYAPAPASVVGRVAAIERVCAAFAVPLKAAALQFPRGHPAVACVLAGARTPAEVEENATLARHPIPTAFWRALIDENLVDPAAPLPAASPP